MPESSNSKPFYGDLIQKAKELESAVKRLKCVKALFVCRQNIPDLLDCTQ